MNESLFETAASATGDWLVAHCDGGSRGNPGPAAFGAVIEDVQGREVARLSEFLGRQTNNYAEYSGLLAVLRWSIENGRKKLRVISDSELMVKQMKGQYKVSNPALKQLWEEAKRLTRQLDGFEIRHTLRGGNQVADKLANDAMDRGMGKNREPGSKSGDQGTGIRDHGAAARDQRSVGRDQRPDAAVKQPRQVIEGYVKDGVVHLLEGELPEGVFVKVVRE
jgi:ribonuclease HI